MHPLQTALLALQGGLAVLMLGHRFVRRRRLLPGTRFYDLVLLCFLLTMALRHGLSLAWPPWSAVPDLPPTAGFAIDLILLVGASGTALLLWRIIRMSP